MATEVTTQSSRQEPSHKASVPDSAPKSVVARAHHRRNLSVGILQRDRFLNSLKVSTPGLLATKNRREDFMSHLDNIKVKVQMLHSANTSVQHVVTVSTASEDEPQLPKISTGSIAWQERSRSPKGWPTEIPGDWSKSSPKFLLDVLRPKPVRAGQPDAINLSKTLAANNSSFDRLKYRTRTGGLRDDMFYNPFSG